MLYKIIYILTCSLIPLNLLAKDEKCFVKQQKGPIQYNQKNIKKIWQLVTGTLIEMEKKETFPLNLKKEASLEKQKNLFSFFIKSLHASRDGDICYFGGWPSIRKGKYCNVPWRQRNNPKIKALGPTYNPHLFCGQKNLFRCNPTLFGTPKQDGPRAAKNPDRGLCVEVAPGYKNVTKKCISAAKDSIDNHLKDLLKKGNEKKLQRFIKHANEISDYCLEETNRTPGYFCWQLATYLDRLKEAAPILETDIDTGRPCPPLTPSSPLPQLPLDSHGFSTVLGQKLPEKGLPYRSRSFEQKLKDYEDSDGVYKMIQRLRSNTTRTCKSAWADGPCTGASRRDSSTNWCWRYVKHGLMGGGFTGSYPYSSTGSAKNAGKENLDRLGFTNIISKDRGKYTLPLKIPLGAILVYSGGKHGHIEVKTGMNEYISDFTSKKLISTHNSEKRLIGVYVKIKV